MPTTLIRRTDEDYPQRLLSLDLAPAQIFVRGVWDARRPCVAVVGSRAASGAGQRAAFAVAQGLCQRGLGVLSGGAIGIDAAAHEGALGASGRTCVVLGTGVDVAYPVRHAGLFDQIVAMGGALLSSFPLGTPPKPWHFPARNRILAALADAVVVVESQPGSGSRYTALAAQSLGKPVYALPGSPGTDELIRGGARTARTPDELVQRILSPHAPVVAQQALFDTSNNDAAPLLPRADEVLRALDQVPRDLSELSRRTGLPASICAAAVMDLELRGFCARTSGGRFVAMEHAS